MNIYVGVTDSGWFEFLAALKPDEVNFWRPKETRGFRTLRPYEPFLFKLRRPKNFIVGGGFFVSYSALPLSVAWDAFEVKNGASSFSDFATKITKYRRSFTSVFEPDPLIGCIVLTSPFFLPEADWITVPESFSSNLLQGKTYHTEESDGAALWAAVQDRLIRTAPAAQAHIPTEELPRYGAEMVVRPRLGQGGFRVLVTDAYHRRCAITGERTLPVLEAAHIRPYAQEGPHQVSNGLLLRSDLHTLLDRGLITITPGYRVEVSPSIRKQYENGRDYYKMHGERLVVLPDREIDRPSRDFIEWHNERVYAA